MKPDHVTEAEETKMQISDADFEAVLKRFVQAARHMQQDGWWWHNAELTNKSIRQRILKETFKR